MNNGRSWNVLLVMIWLLLLAGCSPNGRQQILPPVSGPEQLKLGEQLYAAHCAACHGVLARGGIAGPNLSSSSFRYGKGRAAIVRSILDGRPGGMPSFSAHLSPEQAAYLADFLLQPH